MVARSGGGIVALFAAYIRGGFSWARYSVLLVRTIPSLLLFSWVVGSELVANSALAVGCYALG